MIEVTIARKRAAELREGRRPITYDELIALLNLAEAAYTHEVYVMPPTDPHERDVRRILRAALAAVGMVPIEEQLI
jgi:hypothetical protein